MMTSLHILLILQPIVVCFEVLGTNFLLLPFSHSGLDVETIFHENTSKSKCAYLSSSREDSYSFQYHSISHQCGVHIGRFRSTLKNDTDPHLLIYWQYQDECPLDLGYKYYPAQNVCAKYISTALVFNEASLNCETDGGHLYIANSQEKFDLFRNILHNESVPDAMYLYLGGTDNFMEGSFTWLDGSRNIKWGVKQPDDFGLGEDCIGYLTYKTTIWDVTCTHSRNFICEVPLFN